MKQTKELVVVEVSKFYKNQSYSYNMSKLNDFSQQFKAKFLLARIIKFDPYVLRSTIVAWPKKAQSFVFYKHKFPSHFI